MVDAQALGACSLTGVEVQILFRPLVFYPEMG